MDLYDVITGIHVLGVVIGFGVVFAYPVLLGYLRRQHPRAMPLIHTAQGQIGTKVITPGMLVVLATGIYLATDRSLWDRPWVSGPMLILIVLFGLGGAFFAPQERRAAELATRDVQASPPDTAAFSAEYEAVYRRLQLVGMLAASLVVIAVLLMTAKPGGY